MNFTGVQLTTVENGVFSVFAPNATAMAEAKEMIDKLLTEEASINYLAIINFFYAEYIVCM